MGLLDALAPYKPLLTLCLVVFGPSLAPRLINAIRRFRQKSPGPTRPRPPISHPTLALLAFHTVFILIQLIYPPFDLFSRFPLFINNTALRSVLLGPTATSDTSSARPLEELLLTRLQNLDTRIDYLRFGHRPLLECVWCEGTVDYLIFSLPRIMAPYVLEAIFIGILGWRRVGGEHARLRVTEWRWLFGRVLAVMGLGEIGARYLWDLRPVKGDCLHLSTTIFTLRHVALVLCPLVYTFLPLSSPKPDMASLMPVLVNAQNTIRLTALTRTAVKRDFRFWRAAVVATEKEAAATARAQSSHDVQEMVAAARIDVNAVRDSAQRWVRNGWQSLIRVEPSSQPSPWR